MVYNRIMLIGHVGTLPVTRGDDKKSVTFSLATTEKWKNKKTGEMESKTLWHNVIAFHQSLIPIIEKYVHRGKKILVEGTIDYNEWTDKNEVQRKSTSIIANTIKLLDSKGNAEKNVDEVEF